MSKILEKQAYFLLGLKDKVFQQDQPIKIEVRNLIPCDFPALKYFLRSFLWATNLDCSQKSLRLIHKVYSTYN